MKKFIFTVLSLVLLASTTGFSQWTYQGAWPDTNYKGGTHGIAVSPDGKVWTSSYYSSDWVSPDGDTLSVSPILVFNADGSFVDTIAIVTSGFEVDTLDGACRGMGTDQDGNILYTQSSPSKVIKINYQTMEGMGSHLCSETGSSPTNAVASDDGTIYIGPVVGGEGKAIAMYDASLAYVGNAVAGPPAISRVLNVSHDGSTIYWPPFTGLMMYIYSRPDEFSDYALVDSALAGMSIESTAWDPLTGNLWVSNDARGTGPYTNLTWYEYNPTTKALVDSFTLPSPLAEPSDELPRGIAFSPDGKIAYVGLFGSGYDRVYKFTRGAVDVKDGQPALVNDFSLSQNYPNPFNPSTEIKFSIAKQGMVTLKVYDMLGREVATLVNNVMNSGQHSINFNAAKLASGTYVYQLNANGNMLTKKMILMK